jgi:transposase InsO family protein
MKKRLTFIEQVFSRRILSMDGKARWIDNVIIERWFRSLKTEHIHIVEYLDPRQLRNGIKEYVKIYNHERPHQSLGYKRRIRSIAKHFTA